MTEKQILNFKRSNEFFNLSRLRECGYGEAEPDKVTVVETVLVELRKKVSELKRIEQEQWDAGNHELLVMASEQNAEDTLKECFHNPNESFEFESVRYFQAVIGTLENMSEGDLKPYLGLINP